MSALTGCIETDKRGDYLVKSANTKSKNDTQIPGSFCIPNLVIYASPVFRVIQFLGQGV